nr:retrovirus-related Pol polyprotein from transposon TNT 1-94 [Tanacetum cinerariifolium]
TPQQNGVVERRNRTFVEVARTMLTFANLPSFLWAEAIATACFTQNRSIIHKHFDKTPYELINKRKPNIKFFRVFECICYLLNDYEDVGKLKAKGDIGVFVGYLKESVAFRIYNKRTHLDTFSSVRRPKNSDVIWKKKGSSNTSNVGLSAVSVLNLNKNVKMCDLLDDNNFFIFDDIYVRISPVSKMPFRKKPRDYAYCPDLSLDHRFGMFKAYDG